MASEQLSRRENATTERDIRVEKYRVPKMTTHFEQLTVQGKEPPQGSTEALQGGEINKEHAGKAIGDVGARETHELGSHFKPLADKVKPDNRKEKKQSATTTADHPAASNVVGAKAAGEEATKGREKAFDGARDVGKFEMQADQGKSLGDECLNGGSRNREELERRTRVVTGTPQTKERNIGLGKGKGEVVAEKARGEEKLRGRDIGAENERAVWRKSAEQKERERAEREEQEKLRGRGGVENEGAIWRKKAEQKERERAEREEEEKENEEEKRSTLEEISKYRNQAQQSAIDAISAAQERYESAKQATKTAQAKDIAMEKGQQGYEATKDTVSSAAKTAAEYTAPVVEKAKTVGGTTASYVGEKAVQAKDVTLETGKTAAEIAGKVAADLKDKATVAGWTAANYSTELTVEGTKAAANVVEGAAGYAGHKAAELAAKSVDVVKGLAASAGETAKEFTARKKEESRREYEAKKAAQSQVGEERPSEGIGQTVSNYAQNVMPSGGSPQGGQAQGGIGTNVLSSIGETVGIVGEKVNKPFENITSGEGKRESAGIGNQQGKGSEAMGVTTNIGEKIGDAAQMMKKPLNKITDGGSEVLGAVSETVSDIGNNLIKSAEKVQERGSVQEGQKSRGGVLDAIGETIVEIAQTTKVIVVGEGEKESTMNNIGSSETRSTDRVIKHEVDQPPKRA